MPYVILRKIHNSLLLIFRILTMFFAFTNLEIRSSIKLSLRKILKLFTSLPVRITLMAM